MGKIVTQPTAVAQWQLLINEAQQACEQPLNESLEYYLVRLLMRFMEAPDLINSVLALEFIEGMQAPHEQREERLRDVGDKCLLVSGLFPNQAQRRHVSVGYYVGLGQSAYDTLAHLDNRETFPYVDLCQHFVKLMDILQATRDIHGEVSLPPLLVQEIWQQTNSRYAWRRLLAQTDGMPIASDMSQTKPH